MQVEFIENQKFNAIQYDGTNLQEIKEKFNADIRESPMGSQALFFNGEIQSEIMPGCYFLQEIGNETNVFVFDALSFSEIFKTI